MRKQLFILASLLLTGTAFAQLQKGNGILSGNVSVDYSRQNYPFISQSSTGLTTTWRPALVITAGRFWTDNWLAGLSVSGGATLTRQNLATNPNRTYPTTLSSATATPFVRRYWQITNFYLFAGAGLSVGLIKNVQSYFDSQGQLIESGRKSSLVTLDPRLEVGGNYFLTNRLTLQLTASSTALPSTTAGLSAGLVYWTGPGRSVVSEQEGANPQTDRGRWVLEGSLSVLKQKNKQIASTDNNAYESGYTIYSFSPSIGLFMKKNTLIGVSLPIAYTTNQFTTVNSAQTDNTWSVGIAPYVQHYWTTTRLTPYTRVSVSYAHDTGEVLSNRISGGVNLGLAYMAGQRFIIETSLANASVTYIAAHGSSTVNEIKTWGGQLSAGLTGNFAIRYVL